MNSYIRDNHFLKAMGMRKEVESMIKGNFASDDKRALSEKLIEIEKSNALTKSEIDLLFNVIKLGNKFAHEQDFDCEEDYIESLYNSFNLNKKTISDKLASLVFAETTNTPIASSNADIVDVTPAGGKAYDFKSSARVDDSVRKMKKAGKGKELINSIFALVLTCGLIVGVVFALAYKFDFGPNFSAEADAEKLAVAHEMLYSHIPWLEDK